MPDSPSAARHDVTALHSMRLAQTPKIARRLAVAIVVGLILLPFGLIFIPWQQTVNGQGRAMAFDPVERTQFIVAPIEGRVKKWHVVEGQTVKTGDLLVEMLDIDPELNRRLETEAQALETQMTLALSGENEVERRITDLERSQKATLEQQQAIIREIERTEDERRQGIIAAEASYGVAKLEYDRMVEVNKGGKDLIAVQIVDNARRTMLTTEATVKAEKERLKQAGERLKAAQEFLVRIRADTDAQIKGERIALVRASSEVQGVTQRIQLTNNRIARQRQQTIYSPVDGQIFRITANAEGQLIRTGERMATLVPTIKRGTERDRAIAEQGTSTLGLLLGASLAPVAGGPQSIASLAPPEAMNALTRRDDPGIVAELFIDGNDLPLVREGDRVRLQFEGWAAVQFVAFPQAAEGTFGGLVHLVDPTSNDKGEFRLLVRPDPNDRPWPAQDLLRQGVRAQGWVLLEQPVPLWWELWRQLNGFPPIRSIEKKDETGALGPVPPRKKK